MPPTLGREDARNAKDEIDDTVCGTAYADTGPAVAAVTTRDADPHTFPGFARLVVAATPPTGVLDAASPGVWGVAEQAGLLAGVWRRHRNLMQELDVVAVSGILGDVLVAVAQTAHALDVSLDDVAQQQVARLQASTSAVRSITRGARHPKPTSAASLAALVAPPLPTPRPAPDLGPTAGGRRTRAAPRQAPPGETPRVPLSAAKSPPITGVHPAPADRAAGSSDSAVGALRRLGRPSAAAQGQESESAPRLAHRSRRTESAPPAPTPMGAQRIAPLAPPMLAPPMLAERHVPVATGTKGKQSTPIPTASGGARTAPRTPRTPRARSAQTEGTQAPPASK